MDRDLLNGSLWLPFRWWELISRVLLDAVVTVRRSVLRFLKEHFQFSVLVWSGSGKAHWSLDNLFHNSLKVQVMIHRQEVLVLEHCSYWDEGWLCVCVCRVEPCSMSLCVIAPTHRSVWTVKTWCRRWTVCWTRWRPSVTYVHCVCVCLLSVCVCLCVSVCGKGRDILPSPVCRESAAASGKASVGKASVTWWTSASGAPTWWVTCCLLILLYKVHQYMAQTSFSSSSKAPTTVMKLTITVVLCSGTCR